MKPLHYQSAGELATELRQGRISSVELTRHFMDRARRSAGSLNAVTYLDEGAIDRAGQADAALARGVVRGPLHGLPMLLKDCWISREMPTACGVSRLKDNIAGENAPVVQRLLDAGVIIMGRTNVPSFCTDLQTFNKPFGITNNPWNPERTAGGSSGGAAAAVAAGLTPFELGSDLAGSLRFPAAFCGVYSHKSSYGVAPASGHILGDNDPATALDMLVPGPVARSVSDLRLIFDLITGPGEDDVRAWSLNLPPARHDRIGDFRVGILPAAAGGRMGEEVARVFEQTRHIIEGAGVTISHPEGIHLDDLMATYHRLLDPVYGLALPPSLLQFAEDYAKNSGSEDHSVMGSFAANTSARHIDWIKAHEERNRIRRMFARIFRSCDVLLCPVAMIPAFPHDTKGTMVERTLQVDDQPVNYLDIMQWITMANLAWLPATTLPAGFSRDGLPVGLQVIGPYLEDHTTLRFAELLAEWLAPWRPPETEF